MRKLLFATALAALTFVGGDMIPAIGVSDAQACSIMASGRCGGSACPSGQACTKIDETGCKCVAKSSRGQQRTNKPKN